MGQTAALVLIFLLHCGCSHALGPGQHTELMRTQHDEGRIQNECGSWQAAYTKLHRDILAGREPQRYAIANTWSGLADAQIGAVSVFYYALLTGRAFVWAYEHLEAAYDKPNINWSWPWEERTDTGTTDNSTQANFQAGQSTRRLPPGGVNSTHYVLYQNCKPSGNAADVVWRTTDISKLGEEYQYVYFNSNRGLLNMLFVNPHHEQALRALGIRPDSAFGCAYNYLVTLREDVAMSHQAAMQQLSRPDVLKIGVQVRFGDEFLVGSNHTLPDYEAYFKCAEEIEATRGKAYPGGVVWYLISDSIAVRKLARERYGDKLIDTTQHKHIGHVADKAFRHQSMSAESTMGQACAENWLLGMTDVQVITKRSGFGRTAAFRSLRWHNIYTIDPAVKGVFPSRRCGLDNFDSIDIVGRHWSRIR